MLRDHPCPQPRVTFSVLAFHTGVVTGSGQGWNSGLGLQSLSDPDHTQCPHQKVLETGVWLMCVWGWGSPGAPAIAWTEVSGW